VAHTGFDGAVRAGGEAAVRFPVRRWGAQWRPGAPMGPHLTMLRSGSLIKLKKKLYKTRRIKITRKARFFLIQDIPESPSAYVSERSGPQGPSSAGLDEDGSNAVADRRARIRPSCLCHLHTCSPSIAADPHTRLSHPRPCHDCAKSPGRRTINRDDHVKPAKKTWPDARTYHKTYKLKPPPPESHDVGPVS